MAHPIEAATNLFGSFVSFLAITQKTIWPGFKRGRPFSFGIFLHPGGTMLETPTKLNLAMPASRKASSKEVSRSFAIPTPLVKRSEEHTSELQSQSNLVC